MSFIDDAFYGVKKTGGEVLNKIGDTVSEVLKSATDSQRVSGYSVFEIGRPFHFTPIVDNYDRTYKFLLTRMNVVDLYPCAYAQNFLYSTTESKTRFKYSVGYEIAMKRYRKMCKEYLGDLNPPSALRVFLTDDTVVTDGVNTMYSENFFQSMADRFSSMAQNFTSLTASMTSAGSQEAIDKLLGDVLNTEKMTNAIGNATGMEGKTRDVMGNIITNLKQGMSIVLKGNKLSLPKIWQNSSYTPSFSVSTRLFSPYGSPKAVKEFIIKPLVYLLLLATPQSDDMVSYGRPFPVTVRSWGTSFLSLAGITSISLQRGGSDSVYNKSICCINK